MKTSKVFFFLCLIQFSYFSYGQSYTPGTNIQANRTTTGYGISANTNAADGPSIEMYGNSVATRQGLITFLAGHSTNWASNWRAFQFSQYNGTNWPGLVTITRDGRFGIGHFEYEWEVAARIHAGTNHTRFTVGDISGSTYSGNVCIGLNAVKQTDNAVGLLSNGTDNGGVLLYGTMAGGLNFATFKSGEYGSKTGSQWATSTQVLANNIRMSITPSGKVIIGNPSGINFTSTAFETSPYALFVPTGIRTEAVKVDLKTSWADFVFDENYKLSSLAEVESFIKENKHLPEIPSAEEVKNNGIDLAEMDAKLLQKIEELTLYMIELKKENDKLKERVQLLEE